MALLEEHLTWVVQACFSSLSLDCSICKASGSAAGAFFFLGVQSCKVQLTQLQSPEILP